MAKKTTIAKAVIKNAPSTVLPAEKPAGENPAAGSPSGAATSPDPLVEKPAVNSSAPPTEPSATAKPPVSDDGKAHYPVVSALRHNGTEYAEGKSILLELNEARPLIAAGVIEGSPSA